MKASFADVWRALHAAIENDDRLRAEEEDEKEGTLSAGMRRVADRRPEEFGRELLRIADIEKARRAGLRQVSEYTVEYTVNVGRLTELETRLEITTRITAVDRSEMVFMPPGILQVIPRNFDLPSRGLLEREFVSRVAEHLFLGEEMLYYLGELGRE